MRSIVMKSQDAMVTKKSYTSPKFTVYGNIRELTQNTSLGQGPDNCGNPQLFGRSVVGNGCPV